MAGLSNTKKNMQECMSLPETGYGSSLVQALPARNKVSNILCFKFFTLHFLMTVLQCILNV